MRRMSDRAAERLGDELLVMGFRPLPDVDEEGRLRGVRLWRPRPGQVEYIALRASGLAFAGRVADDFDFRRPFQHGPVLDTRLGHASTVLRWLLAGADLEKTQPIPVATPPWLDTA